MLRSLSRTRAVAVDNSDIGVMQEVIQQRDDAGGIGEKLVPFFEGPVRGEDDRLALVAAVNDLIKGLPGRRGVCPIGHKRTDLHRRGRLHQTLGRLQQLVTEHCSALMS
jgi:hypothetical protein